MTIRTFLTINAVLAVGAWLLSAKNMALAAIMMTLGLAYPLACLPTALIYFNAVMVPVLLLRRPLALGRGAAVVTSLTLALLPGILSKAAEREIEARIERETIIYPIGGSARNIELRYGRSWYYSPLEEEVCGQVCRRLLLSGAADVITITTNERDRKRTESTAFVAANGPACVRPEVSGELRCVVPRIGETPLPDLIIQATQVQEPGPLSPFDLAPRFFDGQIVTGSLRGQDGSVRTVFSKRAERVSVVMMPYTIGPHIDGMSSLGYETVFVTGSILNPVTLEDVFSGLGYAMGADPR